MSADIMLWLIRNISSGTLKKAFQMLHLPKRHRHILMKRQMSLMQEGQVKFSMCSYMIFRVQVFSSPKIDWHLQRAQKDMLHSRQNSQQECTGVAALILFACSDIFKLDLGTTLVKGCVKSVQALFERRLLMNHTKFPRFLLDHV